MMLGEYIRSEQGLYVPRRRRRHVELAPTGSLFGPTLNGFTKQGSGIVNPSTIFGADLAFWFDGNVACSGSLWEDQGPAGIDLSQGTGARQPNAAPTLDTQNGLTFTNTNSDNMASAANALTLGKFQMWFVGSFNGPDRLYSHLPSGGTQHHAIYMSGANQGFLTDVTGGASYSIIAASTLNNPTPVGRVISHLWDGGSGSHDILVDRASVRTSFVLSGSPSTTPTVGDLYLGSYEGTTEYMAMDIYEWFCVSGRAATAPETTLVDAYIAAKFPSLP
jgi:hypothetical protein